MSVCRPSVPPEACSHLPLAGAPLLSPSRRRPIATGFLLGLALLYPGPAWSGAWTEPAGRLYARLSGNRYFADREFAASGTSRPFALHGEFLDWNGALYAEYGLDSRVTAATSLAYKSLRDRSDTGESKSWGIGDVDLALRFMFAEGSAGVGSVQLLVKAPWTYDADTPLPLGNGQADYEARLLFGRSLWQIFPGYGNLEVAHRWRDGDPSDEMRYLVEVGSDFGRRLYGRAKFDAIDSRRNGRSTDIRGNPTAQNNYDLARLDLVAGVKLDPHWSIEIGGAPSLSGRTTAAGTTVSAAVAYVNR